MTIWHQMPSALKENGLQGEDERFPPPRLASCALPSASERDFQVALASAGTSACELFERSSALCWLTERRSFVRS
jgi:hypothetical protein